jgi:hypothetical protein
MNKQLIRNEIEQVLQERSDRVWHILSILWLIFGGLGVIIIILSIPYQVGYHLGHSQGFNDGANYQWNRTVNLINHYGQVEMINADHTLNMTIEKQHDCYDDMFVANPSLIPLIPYSTNITFIGANKK